MRSIIFSLPSCGCILVISSQPCRPVSVCPLTMNISFVKIIFVFTLPNVKQGSCGDRFPVVSTSSMPRLGARVISRKLPRKPSLEVIRRRPFQDAKKILTKSLDRFSVLPSKYKYGGQDKNQDKQLFLASPRPLFPIRLNPAAFLIPAIPTVLGLLVEY